MTPHEFEQRLQQCWDERRDPADDAEVGAWLLDHPEALEDFARRRAALAEFAALAALASHRVATPRHVRLALLAAASVAAALVLWWLPTRPDAPTARVLAATLQVSRPQGHAAVSWREREVLCANGQSRLEIIQHKSERR